MIARWTVHLLFAIPILAVLALAVWMIALSAGPLLHTAGVILVVLLFGAAWGTMRGR